MSSKILFTPAQAEAISEMSKPLQLIACAGSGKTEVLAQRIANILQQPGVQPKNVIAFTFTDKAAAELKERIYRTVGAAIPDIVGMAEMYVGTIHGYCLDMLQTFLPETFKYGVLTDITQQLLIDRMSVKSGLTTCTKNVGGKVTTLSRFKDTRYYKGALSVLREDDVTFGLVPDAVKASLASYQNLLTKQRYFDYTSMMVEAVRFLERSQVGLTLDTAEQSMRDHIECDVKFVIVDEYQDVNPIQEKLVQRLVHFGANLCVVGDDDQTIYQWRGSEVRNIIDFASRYSDARSIRLEENFRSSKGIVELGRSVAERLDSVERLPKKMLDASHQTWERGDMLALQFENDDDEASWIAERIQGLQGVRFKDRPDSPPRGLSWSDCAVLFRSVKDADALVDELRRRGVPFIIKGLARLFDSVEIQACAGIFRYVLRKVSEPDLRDLWDRAMLVPDSSRWPDAIKVLDDGADFTRSSAWGVYNIQRLFLRFMEVLDLHEGTIAPTDPRRAELVMYQLGKFSQVISDFEAIHFSSDPESKYKSFDGFLTYHAPSVYEESDEDAGYVAPDAVVISTVHRAKGLQWPAVFVPFLRANRFPIKAPGGTQTIPHIVPLEAVPNGTRYKTNRSDETRLFYVAVTRAQKYLYCTYAPGDSATYRRASDFYLHCTASTWMSTTDEGLPPTGRLDPTPQRDTPNIAVSFSELKYLIECPYQFKLRFMYGFNPPIHEALGYGKGLHDAIAEMHKRALVGDVPDRSEAEVLVDRHLHTPYAYPKLAEELRSAAVNALERYFDRHGADLTRTIHSEKFIEVEISPGVTVSGRIDLIKSLETGETAIVDFKSTKDSQSESVTRDQLLIYSLGYRQLTGDDAHRVQILNLDDQGKSTNDPVSPHHVAAIKAKIDGVAKDIRANYLACNHDHAKESVFDDLAWLTTGGRAFER